MQRSATTAIEADPARRLILRAMRELAGWERALIYDVPAGAAPMPLREGSIFLRGSPAWEGYLTERERFDDGRLALLIAARALGEVERRLVVDWGTTYANSLLLVEPHDAAFDLTDEENPNAPVLRSAARALLRHREPDDDPGVPWTRGSALGEQLRAAYGVWIVWSGGRGAYQIRREALVAGGRDETLIDLIQPRLAEMFPQATFDQAVARLHDQEAELFHGPVAGVRRPFQTRLGLPVLHDPLYVDRAVRRLVNAGQAWAFSQGADAVSYHGPDRPIPDVMADGEVGSLVM